MKRDFDAGIREALEPPNEAIERIVTGALAAPQPTPAVRSAWLWAAGLVAASAILVSYARQEPTFTEPSLFVPKTTVEGRVSNFGGLMVVVRLDGRTLIVNRAADLQQPRNDSPYRLMISKGTAP
jgi:hypothetical protein